MAAEALPRGLRSERPRANVFGPSRDRVRRVHDSSAPTHRADAESPHRMGLSHRVTTKPHEPVPAVAIEIAVAVGSNTVIESQGKSVGQTGVAKTPRIKTARRVKLNGKRTGPPYSSQETGLWSSTVLG